MSLKARLPNLSASQQVVQDTMRLNAHGNHLFVIVNFKQYCNVYKGIHCNKLRNNVTNYHRHTKSCITTVRETFPGGIHKNFTTIFKKLEEIEVVLPHSDRHFPFFVCFDFKMYFSKHQSSSFMLTLDAGHFSLSVPIASNIPGYESGVCFATKGSEKRLVEKLVSYLKILSDTSFDLMLQKFDYVFEQLESNENVMEKKF